MRTIAIVTVARSDYGIYRPVLRRIQREPGLRLMLFAAGMHLSPQFGMTVNAIEQDGFGVDERVEMLLSSDTPEGVAKSLGLGVIGFAQAYARSRPDILVVLGDRYEMLAAAAAALPFKIPVAHIHGGESTEGAIDESIRHSITKMSHLHFASTEAYARRIVQMGEEPWRVTVSGAPGLDNLTDLYPLSREELEAQYGLCLSDPIGALLVTYHPVTLEYEQTEAQVVELLSALWGAAMPVVFTYPNADTNNHVIAEMIEDFVARTPDARLVANMGTQGYFSLMSMAAAMVGNSSSGIIEAASFKLPVVNVGNRQAGRIRPRNVIDVACHREAILGGIRRATSSEFRASLSDLVNPYGDGHAAERIVQRLKTVCLDDKILVKRFCDAKAKEESTDYTDYTDDTD
jgi:UDP-hydrolysing UDP-N-acetyl-D-glucosamine 2-epimerase